MKYALNLGGDSRILSATYEKYAPVGAVLVDELPKGNITDYLYMNGEYIYEPLPEPKPEEVEPTAEEDTAAMLVDHEFRLTMLELGITE